MPIVPHKLPNYQPNPATEILILGTVTPDVAGAPDFFYGRPRNFLWHLLPQAYGLPPLKDEPLSSKQAFMAKYKIDFADVIKSIDLPDGLEAEAEDDTADAYVSEWKDVITIIDALPHLKAVYFTRKTFNGLPNVRAQITPLAQHCRQKGIRFCKLETPARHYSDTKLQQWKDTIVAQTTCLRP